MKRSGRVVFVFVLLCVAVSAGAQATTPSATGTSTPAIATLSFNNAVLGTAEAKRNLEAVQKKFAQREQALQKMSAEIETEKKLLNEGTAKLSERESSQRFSALAAKDKQFQRDAEDFKNDYQAESEEAFQRVAQKVYAFVQEYALQHRYTTVLERGSDATPVVWYAAPNIDITEHVAKAYDQKFDTAGEPPESPTVNRKR